MTGLEPAASGVTGRRSNQLSYTRMVCGAVYIRGGSVWQGLFDSFFKEQVCARRVLLIGGDLVLKQV